jgi:cytoskeletal protein CcmA (bactofilin family)
MALWDKNEPSSTSTTPATPPPQPVTPPPLNQPARPAATATKERTDMSESLIASGLTIEGKIIGKGNVRVAGKFKGDIQVEGDLHIDSGSRVEGQVKAGEVCVVGELQGNIESAKHVELKQGSTMTGDLKAGSLTVAAGARMRGNVDFGFDESKKA